MKRSNPLGAFLAILFWSASCCGAQEIVATPAKAGGVYEVGDTISWRFEFKGDAKQIGYVIKRGGMTVTKEGNIELADGAGTLETSLDEPGTVLVELKAKVGDREVKSAVGAAVAPEKIKPSAERPADFVEFWKAKVEQLHAIPANPVLEAIDVGKPTVEYAKIRMDNINGSHIYGQVAKPKKEGKFPALLIVQWASVYPLQREWVTNRAANGWLALNIMAHDLPIDEPAEFYKKASDTTLKDYTSIGSSDREKTYFLRMYLSCYRAMDYLASREDWDGKTIVVMGTSQGGQQAIVTAGFHPKVTAMIASVPAGCDVTGPRIGRAAGFPYWADQARWRKDDKIVEVGRYFDAANFAQDIKCPALVAMGLIDVTCPPSGVFSAVNRMQGPKEIVVMVKSDHQGKGNAQAAFYGRSEVWLKALVKGEPVPVK